jgi:hypothetical protein
MSTHTRQYWLAGIVLVLVGIFAGLTVIRRDASAPPVGEKEAVPAAGPDTRAPRSAGQPADREAERSSAETGAAIRDLLRTSQEKFRANADPAVARNLLTALRDGIRQAPDEAATAEEIIAFLKSGEDAPTGQPFVVGPDGMMEMVPTLRTALLDLLPALDPVAALEIARAIMDQRTSPDEYALALRNMAWNDLDGDIRDELAARFSDLLKTPWLDQPSAGLLESFDIAVEIGGSAMFDRLVSVAREAHQKPDNSAGRAAFMALDQMVVRNPEVLTAALSSDAAWMDFAPTQRASLVSRLNITDPAQRELFTRYLASPRAPGELDYFAEIFPNGNFLYGHRLVTTTQPTPTIAEMAARDRLVLAELDRIEPTLTAEAKAVVGKIRARLQAR